MPPPPPAESAHPRGGGVTTSGRISASHERTGDSRSSFSEIGASVRSRLQGVYSPILPTCGEACVFNQRMSYSQTATFIIKQECKLGLTYAKLKLTNDFRQLSIEVDALVDTGAMFLCVPEPVAAQLGFDTAEARQRIVTLADGSSRKVPVVSPVTIEFENRWYTSEALVLGDEPLIGCIPMEAMDVIVEPKTQRMVVNPKHPNFAVSLVKGLN